MLSVADREGAGLMTALFELSAAGPEQMAAGVEAARKAAVVIRKAAMGRVLMDLVDRNPFGVEVGIRAKLGGALDWIAASV